MSSEAPRNLSEQPRSKKRARYTQVAWYVVLPLPSMESELMSSVLQQ